MQKPRGVRCAGTVLMARQALTAPGFVHGAPTRGARAQGVRYERKVQAHLLNEFPAYVASPWLQYQSAGSSRVRWCQPDGVHLDIRQGVCTIVEIKYQHCEKAYWQMQHLYRPVLEAILQDGWEFRYCEVVKWFDPCAPFPCSPKLCATILHAPSEGVGVHIWKP